MQIEIVKKVIYNKSSGFLDFYLGKKATVSVNAFHLKIPKVTGEKMCEVVHDPSMGCYEKSSIKYLVPLSVGELEEIRLNVLKDRARKSAQSILKAFRKIENSC